MLLETSSAKNKFLNKYFQPAIQRRRFVTDGPLQMNKLTMDHLVILSRECVSNDYPRSNRSILQEVLDDYQLESPITYANPESSDSLASSGEDIRDDFIEYVRTLRPKVTILNTPAKTNFRSASYPGLHTPKLSIKPDFRKTRSLQSVVSHSSVTTTSSATNSDYSMPVTDDEEISPTREHPKTEVIYVLPSDKGKSPETYPCIARKLTFTATENSLTPVPTMQTVVC